MPNLSSKYSKADVSPERRKKGMKTIIAITAMKGSMRFGTNWRQSKTKAAAGKAKKVTELMDVPSIERPMTQPGKERPPRKYFSVE